MRIVCAADSLPMLIGENSGLGRPIAVPVVGSSSAPIGNSTPYWKPAKNPPTKLRDTIDVSNSRPEGIALPGVDTGTTANDWIASSWKCHAPSSPPGSQMNDGLA